MLQKRIQKAVHNAGPLITKGVKSSKQTCTKNKNKQSKEPRCNYQTIPSPSKCLYTSSVNLLYGDIAVKQQNGSLMLDLSLLNNFKRYKSVSVQNLGFEKLITILPEKIDGFTPSSDCKLPFERIEGINEVSSLEWKSTIQNYCKNYEEMVKFLKKKQTESIKKKEKHSETTKTTEKTKIKLTKGFPCIVLKRRFKGEDFSLSEISFSEKFLTLIGFSTDSFISTVFKEGIPQIEAYGSDNHMTLLKSLAHSFSLLEATDSNHFEYSSYLALNYGYVRKVSYKIHHLPNYEDGSFVLDTVFAVVSKEAPQLSFKSVFNSTLSFGFLKTAVSEDEEAAEFLGKYYQEEKIQRYKYGFKVCKIRDIEGEVPVLYQDRTGSVQYNLVKEDDDIHLKDESLKKE